MPSLLRPCTWKSACFATMRMKGANERLGREEMWAIDSMD